MRGPVAAALALAACGLVLLGAGQPWAATVTEAAPGAPRWPGAVTAGGLVPWLAPLVLVAALALLGALARLRWARYAALLALSAASAGAVLAVVRAGRTGDGTVSSHPTAWAWIGLGSVLLALLAVVLWRPGRPGGAREAGGAPAARPAWDEERRRTEQVWRGLSRGEDPDAP